MANACEAIPQVVNLAENVGEMACSNCSSCANPWTKPCSNIMKTWHVLLCLNIVLEITDAVLERKTIDDIKDKIATYKGSNITEWCNESHAMNSIKSTMSGQSTVIMAVTSGD